jgi:hypothetical protein
MSFSLSQVNTAALAVGAAAWALALVAIWLVPRKDPTLGREQDFLEWKNLNRSPSASFGEFLASEQTPRIYLSRVDLSVVITVLALIALVSALHHWGVWQ